MKTILTFLLGVSTILVFDAMVRGGPEDPAADPTAGSKFIGAKECKRCHFKQHRSWKKMKHATAWKNLPKEYRAPDQKDEDGRLCISCHVTGFGEQARGGFENAEKSAHLLGVQCEACHGAGSQHKVAGQKVLDDKRKDFKEGEPSFTIMNPTACAGCHNPHVSHAKFKPKKED